MVVLGQYIQHIHAGPWIVRMVPSQASKRSWRMCGRRVGQTAATTNRCQARHATRLGHLQSALVRTFCTTNFIEPFRGVCSMLSHQLAQHILLLVLQPDVWHGACFGKGLQAHRAHHRPGAGK